MSLLRDIFQKDADKVVLELRGKPNPFKVLYLQFLEVPRGTVIVVSVLFLTLLSAYIFTISPPRHFPAGSIIRIEEGENVNEIAHDLKRQSVIRSVFFFKTLVRTLRIDDKIKAGDYFFPKDRSLFSLTHAVVRGNYGMVPLSVTIPEGATSYEMADILEDELPNFNRERFLKHAIILEGYLFPDTYFFLPSVSEEQIVRTMKNNFIGRISTIEKELKESGKTFEDVVIMASLIEKEAWQSNTRRMISGILWRRIEMGMLLQVDAVFPYIIGRNTFEVTLEDLQYDSPYNTYRYSGLPLGPISNPSLDSLLAAVSPIESDYLFYLADRSGVTHYSRTFEEHKQKKRMYLN